MALQQGYRVLRRNTEQWLRDERELGRIAVALNNAIRDGQITPMFPGKPYRNRASDYEMLCGNTGGYRFQLHWDDSEERPMLLQWEESEEVEDHIRINGEVFSTEVLRRYVYINWRADGRMYMLCKTTPRVPHPTVIKVTDRSQFTLSRPVEGLRTRLWASDGWRDFVDGLYSFPWKEMEILELTVRRGRPSNYRWCGHLVRDADLQVLEAAERVQRVAPAA